MAQLMSMAKFHRLALGADEKGRASSRQESAKLGTVLIRTCVSRDLKNDKIVGQVWALAMLVKLLTGPWMTRFYSSTLSNLEMAPFIKLCIRNIKCWLEDPKVLLHPVADAFDKQLDPSSDDVLSSLLDFAFEEKPKQLMFDALKGVLVGALSILERQLAPFLIGQFSQPSIEVQEISASAPTHNMASERTLGCLDKMWRRAPNASLGFFNGKVRFKMNKVMEWLEGKSAKERKLLVSFVVSEARDERGREALRQ